MHELGFVTLTVYLDEDVAEVSRVLQMMVRQPLAMERFNVHLVPGDVRSVKGLEQVRRPVIRLAIIGTSRSDADLERTTKSLNRLVSVLKVVTERL